MWTSILSALAVIFLIVICIFGILVLGFMIMLKCILPDDDIDPVQNELSYEDNFYVYFFDDWMML